MLFIIRNNKGEIVRLASTRNEAFSIQDFLTRTNRAEAPYTVGY